MLKLAHMEPVLEKRRLNDKEVDAIVDEIKKFPNPLTGKKAWQSFKKVYVITAQNNLIGVCAINTLKNWIKLGPFVVFEKHHGQGYGKKILESIMKDYPNDNLFIGSRNPAVAKISLNLGFDETKSFWKLPSTIKNNLIQDIVQSVNFNYVKECIRKNPTQEGPFRFFIRQKNTSFD